MRSINNFVFLTNAITTYFYDKELKHKNEFISHCFVLDDFKPNSMRTENRNLQFAAYKWLYLCICAYNCITSLSSKKYHIQNADVFPVHF